MKLPNVAGRRIRGSNDDFERACLVHIERLQHGLGDYDSAMLDTFCEAVRLVREYNDAVPFEEWKDIEAGVEVAKAVREADLEIVKRLERRAADINCAHAHTDEDRVVRRAMVVIFSELAEMLREEEKRKIKDCFPSPTGGK